VGGVEQALRFFTREDAATDRHYTAINEHFRARDLTAYVATCRWRDNAVEVRGERYPMVQMEWINGKPLDKHVAGLVEAADLAAVEKLARTWRDLLRTIQRAGFAHGDLQHGNVLVDTQGRLRLVDFDCSWIETLAGSTSSPETGHRDYQHPSRVRGPWMDTFSGLVIYLSLTALAAGLDGWDDLHNGDNLLFVAADFRPPHATPVWHAIAALDDPWVNKLADTLRECCAADWTPTCELEILLSGLTTAPVGSERWWLLTGAVTGEIAEVPSPRRPLSSSVRAPGTAPTRKPRVEKVYRGSGDWWKTPAGPKAPVGVVTDHHRTPAPTGRTGVRVLTATLATVLIIICLLSGGWPGVAIAILIAVVAVGVLIAF
jgi:hypothetical protein